MLRQAEPAGPDEPTEGTTCAQCGAVIPAGAPFGQCPRCLLGFATVGPASAPLDLGGPDGLQGRLFGDYKLIVE